MSRSRSERRAGGLSRGLALSVAAHALVVAFFVAVGLARWGRLAPEPPVAPEPEARVDVDLSAPQEGTTSAPGAPRPVAPGRPPRHRTTARAEAQAPAGQPEEPGVEPLRPGPSAGVDLSLRRDPTGGEGGGVRAAPGSLLGQPAGSEPARPRASETPRGEDRPGFVAKVDPDGTVHFENKFPRDANDAIMRMAGMDPYSYEKRRFAEETRPARERMADAARATWRSEALERLPSTLERIWQDTRTPASARRRTLFDLWDECIDAPADADAVAGEASLAGAARLRRTILAFIQAHLPAGSPDAFPPDEIDALNRQRRSHERFEPYGPAPP
jgi:hypothetical protein